MIGKILFLFIVVPLLDIVVLLEVAERIGFLQTVGIVILTGVVGGFLARVQGLMTLRKLQARMATGETPSKELADGALIFAGGVLLLTPGLITDSLGFLLLIPVTRPLIRKVVVGHLRKKAESGTVSFNVSYGGPRNPGTGNQGFGTQSSSKDDGDVHDVDWRELDDEKGK